MTPGGTPEREDTLLVPLPSVDAGVCSCMGGNNPARPSPRLELESIDERRDAGSFPLLDRMLGALPEKDRRPSTLGSRD